MLLHGGRAFTVLFFVPETEANTIGAISMVRDAPLSPTAARKKITSPLKLPPLYCPVLWTGVRVSPGLTHSSAGQGQLESVFLADWPCPRRAWKKHWGPTRSLGKPLGTPRWDWLAGEQRPKYTSSAHPQPQVWRDSPEQVAIEFDGADPPVAM